MFVTDKKAMLIAQHVVDTHAERIIKKLGIIDEAGEDGIIERIFVSKEKSFYSIGVGTFLHVSRVIKGERRYMYGTGKIKINALQMKRVKIGEVIIPVPSIFSSSKDYEVKCIFTIAHEMRHYWQAVTGEMYKHDVWIFGTNITPYEYQWIEQDANQFAREYVKEVLHDVSRVPALSTGRISSY